MIPSKCKTVCDVKRPQTTYPNGLAGYVRDNQRNDHDCASVCLEQLLSCNDPIFNLGTILKNVLACEAYCLVLDCFLQMFLYTIRCL